MKRKQICFFINEEMHRTIKELSKQCNISMNLWMVRAIIQKIARDNPHANSYSSGFNPEEPPDSE